MQSNKQEQASIHAPAADLTSSSSTEQLQELEHDSELLLSRAEAVDQSLSGMRQSQAAQGLSLRGDIAASQQRMRTYVARLQTALRNHDADAAKRYLDLAETEVTGLEKFLSR